MEPKEQTEPVTDVIFRIDRQKEGREVTALFPADPADVNGFYVSCYSSCGGHGSASVAVVVGRTRPATPAEYASLKRELESTPYTYHLRVVKRATRRHCDALQAELNRWKNAPAFAQPIEPPTEPKGTAGA